MLPKFSEFINEAKSTESLVEFAENRLAGASKIAQNAKEKGGDSLLTYHHFNVKLPYYKKAAAGKFNVDSAVTELKSLHDELHSILDKFEPGDQIPFQKVMGKIEVLGELIIRHSKNTKQ